MKRKLSIVERVTKGFMQYCHFNLRVTYVGQRRAGQHRCPESEEAEISRKVGGNTDMVALQTLALSSLSEGDWKYGPGAFLSYTFYRPDLSSTS